MNMDGGVACAISRGLRRLCQRDSRIRAPLSRRCGGCGSADTPHRGSVTRDLGVNTPTQTHTHTRTCTRTSTHGRNVSSLVSCGSLFTHASLSLFVSLCFSPSLSLSLSFSIGSSLSGYLSPPPQKNTPLSQKQLIGRRGGGEGGVILSGGCHGNGCQGPPRVYCSYLCTKRDRQFVECVTLNGRLSLMLV